MKKFLLLGIIAALFLFSLQGCYIGMEPGSDGYYGGNVSDAPPPLSFRTQPDVVVIPDTNNVYVVPDINVDLFFWNGWWWRPWEGRWYRSQYYDRGWSRYNAVPDFYYDVDPAWRGNYRDRNWQGHRWNYERIPNQRLQQSWKSWRDDQYWEKRRIWDVDRYQPKPQHQREELRSQRQFQYQKRVEDQKKPAPRPDPYVQPRVEPPKPQSLKPIPPPVKKDPYVQPRVEPPKPQPLKPVPPPVKKNQYVQPRVEPPKPQPQKPVPPPAKKNQYVQPRVEPPKPQPQKPVPPPQYKAVKPQDGGAVKPQQSRPQYREVPPSQGQPKQREATAQQPDPRQDRPARGGEERQGRM